MVVVMIVVIQLMVLFDVIHVVNTKSPEASDKSFLYTALEVFCLGELSTDVRSGSKEKMKFANSQSSIETSSFSYISYFRP